MYYSATPLEKSPVAKAILSSGESVKDQYARLPLLLTPSQAVPHAAAIQVQPEDKEQGHKVCLSLSGRIHFASSRLDTSDANSSRLQGAIANCSIQKPIAPRSRPVRCYAQRFQFQHPKRSRKKSVGTEMHQQNTNWDQQKLADAKTSFVDLLGVTKVARATRIGMAQEIEHHFGSEASLKSSGQPKPILIASRSMDNLSEFSPQAKSFKTKDQGSPRKARVDLGASLRWRTLTLKTLNPNP